MARLESGESLGVDGRLVSSNGWLMVILQGDGNVVLYRVQTFTPLWATATDGQPVVQLQMRGDGDLVAVRDDGTSAWRSATAGHPGAHADLQDDGNFVVYDGQTPLWASNTVVNFQTPTIRTTDSAGYEYVETSETWKQLCSSLPCFRALQWPGYATQVLEDVIDGEPVVIQLWKGRCQKFLGNEAMPGGIGAEVGIYRRIPGKLAPGSLPPPFDSLFGWLVNAWNGLTTQELWWPAPDLNCRLDFRFVDPYSGEVMFSAGPENSYWLTKWMYESSFTRYGQAHGGRIPASPDSYVLEYWINGKRRVWPDLPRTPVASGSVVEPGQVLTPQTSIFAPGGKFRLTYQDDTNLVLYREADGHATWDIRPQPRGVGVCLMGGDGNFMVFNGDGQPVWTTASNGNTGGRLVLQDDGNLVIYRPDGVAVWASNTAQAIPPTAPQATGDRMTTGQVLGINTSIISPNGRFRLTYQADANLVLYRTGDGRALWDTRPQPGGPGACIMPPIGDLLLVNAVALPVWVTGTATDIGATMVLQDDGNLVIYRQDGTPKWASNTVQPALPSGPAASGDHIGPGEVLGINAAIRSSDGRFRLIYQDDTNLVLYKDNEGRAIWDTRPHPGGPGICTMSPTGVLALYNAAAAPVWVSGPPMNSNSRLVLQDDGNLVIYRPDGGVVWASNTAGA